MMQEPIINIATMAARAAAKLMARARKRPDMITISEKRPHDYVTETDKQIEQAVVDIIRKAYPDHGILGEEGAELQGKDYLWIIDPIDGTRNFIHGLPHYTISIAISYRNRLEHALIYDPERDEFFTASRGKGAHLNGQRIRISQRKQLETALLATNAPYRYDVKQRNHYFQILKTLLPLCGDIRHLGSASLDLAYVACGRLDGFFQMGLKIWDIAAGVLLIKEAGGLVCDIHGGEDYLKTGDLIVGNSALLKQNLKIIKSIVE